MAIFNRKRWNTAKPTKNGFGCACGATKTDWKISQQDTVKVIVKIGNIT